VYVCGKKNSVSTRTSLIFPPTTMLSALVKLKSRRESSDFLNASVSQINIHPSPSSLSAVLRCAELDTKIDSFRGCGETKSVWPRPALPLCCIVCLPCGPGWPLGLWSTIPGGPPAKPARHWDVATFFGRETADAHDEGIKWFGVIIAVWWLCSGYEAVSLLICRALQNKTTKRIEMRSSS
jgi:hypothetical protein